MKTLVAMIFAVLIIAHSPALFAQGFETEKLANWHQWRGPLATGVAPQGNPPLNWDEDTNVKWKTSIEGEGSSTPIIWGDNVFVVSAVETDKVPAVLPTPHPESKTQPPPKIFAFTVWNLDRTTGTVKWKKVVHEAAPHEGRHPSTTYAAASPITDGEHVFASFGSYGIYCLSFDGKIVWTRDLGDMRTRRGWGEAVSPALHDSSLVINWDQEDQSKIFVLDSKTGQTKWEKLRDEPTTWATPLIVEHNGKTQVITNGTKRLRSYDLATGDIIWQSTGTTLNAIPSPILDGTSVICMAGYQGNAAFAVSLDATGETTDTDVKWRFDHDTPYVPSPLLVDGRLYFTKSLQAILNCLDVKTGKPIYDLQRLAGLQNMYASPVAADDKIYFTSREGVTLVIKNSPEFKVLATNKLAEPIDASPAIAGNQLFLRSKTSLYCVE